MLWLSSFCQRAPDFDESFLSQILCRGLIGNFASDVTKDFCTESLGDDRKLGGLIFSDLHLLMMTVAAYKGRRKDLKDERRDDQRAQNVAAKLARWNPLAATIGVKSKRPAFRVVVWNLFEPSG